MLYLKENFKMTEAEKIEARELDDIFLKNDHEYLKDKRLPESIKNRIDKLYFKYLHVIQNGWGKTILDYELEDLKKDGICGHNKNKVYWVKAYLLTWIINAKYEAKAESILRMIISGKDSYKMMIENIYNIID